jgi:hypothetical protein
MNEDAEAFAVQIPNLAQQPKGELIVYFVYLDTVVRRLPGTSPSAVLATFNALRIPPYSNVAAYLAKHSKGRNPRFVKTKEGYALSRVAQLGIQKTLHSGPAKQETSLLLRGLLPKVSSLQQREFLQEAIDCYEIGARRAAIVMVWLLTLNHLFEYVLAKELVAFNAALFADKGVKMNAVASIDDFGEIKEVKQIELLRTAKIISNDVRKILDVKLGIRNSAAHPSAITIAEVKATEFIIDLLENVILKYPR